MGWATGPDGALHAFLWSSGAANGPAGAFIDLDGPSCNSSRANAVNERGQVVGWSWVLAPNGNTSEHATLWEGNRIVDLNDVVEETSWSLREATTIDERGRILVDALHEGVWRVVLLTPVR